MAENIEKQGRRSGASRMLSSSMRVVLLVWSIGVFLIWALASIMSIMGGGTIATVPPEIVTLLAATFTGKGVQTYVEKKFNQEKETL